LDSFSLPVLHSCWENKVLLVRFEWKAEESK
jgi:hypothetical protein